MIRVKKIPQRMCISCREMKPKKALIRLVRTPQYIVELDPTGKSSGRGAYLCPSEDCLRKALKGKKLEKALDCFISQEVVEELKVRIKEGINL